MITVLDYCIFLKIYIHDKAIKASANTIAVQQKSLQRQAFLNNYINSTDSFILQKCY